MDKKQAEKKLQKKKIVWKSWSSKVSFRVAGTDVIVPDVLPKNKNLVITKGATLGKIYPKSGSSLLSWTRKRVPFTTTVAPWMKVKIRNASEKPKRKDSRQVKIDRLETEINLLVTERSSLNSIIRGLKSENSDLKDKNVELENENKEYDKVLWEWIDKIRDALFKEKIKHKTEVNRLQALVFILSVFLIAYATFNIVMGVYGG